jgi:hypothetical protein
MSSPKVSVRVVENPPSPPAPPRPARPRVLREETPHLLNHKRGGRPAGGTVAVGSRWGETDELLQKLALKQRRDTGRRRAGGPLPARGRRRARVHRGQPLFHAREQDVLELRHVLRRGARALRPARSCPREVLWVLRVECRRRGLQEGERQRGTAGRGVGGGEGGRRGSVAAGEERACWLPTATGLPEASSRCCMTGEGSTCLRPLRVQTRGVSAQRSEPARNARARAHPIAIATKSRCSSRTSCTAVRAACAFAASALPAACPSASAGTSSAGTGACSIASRKNGIA